MTTRNVSWAYMKVGLQHVPLTESSLSHDDMAAMLVHFPVDWKHQSGRCGNARLLDRMRNTYVKPSCQGLGCLSSQPLP